MTIDFESFSSPLWIVGAFPTEVGPLRGPLMLMWALDSLVSYLIVTGIGSLKVGRAIAPCSTPQREEGHQQSFA